MSMTREEVNKRLKGLRMRCQRLLVSSRRNPEEWRKDIAALDLALSALRPVSREQVEKVWRGEWVIGEPDVLGVPIHCSRCGWGSDHADQRKWMEYNGHLFCGHCGAPMTDEAVEMVLERLEAQYESVHNN